MSFEFNMPRRALGEATNLSIEDRFQQFLENVYSLVQQNGRQISHIETERNRINDEIKRYTRELGNFFHDTMQKYAADNIQLSAEIKNLTRNLNIALEAIRSHSVTLHAIQLETEKPKIKTKRKPTKKKIAPKKTATKRTSVTNKTKGKK